MDWQAALRSRLTGAGAVTALVGQKIYWENAPQPTARPYVTLLDVTQLRPQHLSGYNLEAARVQIDVWANSYTQKQQIMDAVLNAIVPGAAASNGHNFSRAMIDLGPRDLPERDGETIIYRKSADLIIHHR